MKHALTALTVTLLALQPAQAQSLGFDKVPNPDAVYMALRRAGVTPEETVSEGKPYFMLIVRDLSLSVVTYSEHDVDYSGYATDRKTGEEILIRQDQAQDLYFALKASLGSRFDGRLTYLACGRRVLAKKRYETHCMIGSGDLLKDS